MKEKYSKPEIEVIELLNVELLNGSQEEHDIDPSDPEDVWND